ncbi:hypothetical protein DPMN_164524 [Dreissena polymorpha]|uniref:Uncharacterized protein n=1 Tax=Dreissena polymorpha TaxID=45954 RepID=A0A9D4EUD7_DREPO|nr:hypothetical protein DPMN_164524 [Dreissena polymorpha]
MPVFLKNADSSYRMSQNCVQNITKKFKQEMVKTIEDALESITKLCPNFTANYSKLDALTPLIMCRQGFQFHENSGQCMYCHDCDTGIATSLITTLSTTTPGLTTTTAALTTTTFGLTTTSLGFTTTTHGLTTTELKTTVTVPSTTTPIVPTTSMEPTTTTDAGE